MIAVTGATGRIGSLLLEELATARAPFRALVRSAGKAETVRAMGGEAAVGDAGNPEALRAALKGATRLFLLTPPDPELPSIQAGIVDAAREAGVARIVKLSAAGAEAREPNTLARLHRESERHIEDAGVAHTFLRPSFFMQNYLQFADSIKGQGAIFAPAGDGRHADIEVRDIAAVAARVLTEEGHGARTYTLTGPAAQSLAEGAHTIAMVTGRPVRFVDVPPEDARKALTSSGASEWFADAVIELYAWFLDGEGAASGSAVTHGVEGVLGRPPRPFDQFVRENVRAFGG